MGPIEVLRATLDNLEKVNVNGKMSMRYMLAAIGNLEALIKAYESAGGKEDEDHDGDDQQE